MCNLRKGERNFTPEKLSAIKIYLLKVKEILNSLSFFRGKIKDSAEKTNRDDCINILDLHLIRLSGTHVIWQEHWFNDKTCLCTKIPVILTKTRVPLSFYRRNRRHIVYGPEEIFMN